MAITIATGTDIPEAETPLLKDVVRGYVDFNGRPSSRSKSGCWKSASFIIVVDLVERVASQGISSNLISYLMGPLSQSTATAAANVNTWVGISWILPLLGGFIADSFLGRYRMIIVASLLYILGLGFLSLSTALHSSNSNCKNTSNNTPCPPPRHKVIFFFFSLYLAALAQGGNKPCIQAFGADQFDDENQQEQKAKSSLFNWWNFFLCLTSPLAVLLLNYIQDNWSWELSFGIPCIAMCLALVVFLLGSFTYRFRLESYGRSPFVRIRLVCGEVAKRWSAVPKAVSGEEEAPQTQPHEDDEFKIYCKTILGLIPIWSPCLGYAIVHSQISTLFIKQAATMDRYITSSFQLPAASIQSCVNISIVIFIPIYDRILVPVARTITKNLSGITMLQRIGTGLFFSFVAMVIAALVEKKRLAIAVEYGLVNLPNETLPMSVWWLAPQNLIFGVVDVFTWIGLQEFSYDQVPMACRSIGVALWLSIIGIGHFLSSFLIYVIEKATSGHGRESWFSNNLNRAHLDYFYWLLSGISVIAFAGYVHFAKSYVYYRRNDIENVGR